MDTSQRTSFLLKLLVQYLAEKINNYDHCNIGVKCLLQK